MSKPTNVQDSTTVEQVDINIDELFGTPGAENIMLPAEEEEDKPKNVFTKETVDTSFLDNPVEKTTSKEDSSASVKSEQDIADEIAELDKAILESEEIETTSKGGRPKVDKSGLYELATKMIEEGTLIPFDDDKSLEEYTAADFRELFEANFQERESKAKEKVPQEFFNSLPDELKIAAKYVADGGQDLKGLFRTLAQVEETIQLDPENENHQVEIVRQYLYATNFADGNPEEIESEIQDWADMDKLGEKAMKFKPKLDRMQEEIVARRLAEQEHKKEQQAQAARAYTDNVYNTLVKGEIGGVKLDKKTQSMLYSGLVQPSYPSISGKPTNLLGHLLEKYQFVEPRHDLIAEALWLLQDPEGYKSKIKSVGAKQEVEKTVRTLKTEESRKATTSYSSDTDTQANKKPQRTIQRNTGGFFKR
jgi:hypothetical protein